MSVVAKSTCRGGSNVGDTVSFVMKKKNYTGKICAIGKI